MNNKSIKELSTIAIGRFLKPFGVKGVLKFQSYSGEISHLSQIQSVEDKFNVTAYTVEQWYLTPPIRCKVKGIDSPEEAALLTGRDVYVPREYAAKLNNDEEFYTADLYGLFIYCKGTKQGKIVGLITEAYAPLFEIEWRSGKKSYIPFIKQFFDLPQLSQGRINLLMEELIEL